VAILSISFYQTKNKKSIIDNQKYHALIAKSFKFQMLSLEQFIQFLGQVIDKHNAEQGSHKN
jgi:hypothetical protein